MFGTLTASAFLHGPVETMGQAVTVLGVLAVALLLTYTRRWGWLWREWLTSLDPKRIGVMYLAVALLMLVRGFIDAGMMRLQQSLAAGANEGYLSANHFAQIFTAHGTIMIFFVAMGLMWGTLNLVVPLQIGSRDVAFPFLNSLAFWLFGAGAALVLTSLVIGEFAATGWLAYPPLSELAYSPGVGVDYWIWALQISGIGSLLSGINFFTTILTLRAPGMTLMRMPIFVWTVLCAMVLVIFAFPVLTATLGMLFLDRFLGMHFFTAGMGGNMMLYVSLIWTWGHPEVYILVLPAFGVFSEVVPVFSRKPLFGYGSMVVATIAITFLSFVVWLHHFFTMGAGADVNAFFGITTMIIAVPTGVKIFNWLFTMHRGRITFATPMLWFLGFVATFTLGGAAGVLMAIPGADFQLHNSLFLVAHFHTMIVGGVLFGYFAALAYWFPKFAGFRLNERWGVWAFWCWLVGFFLAFVPLYALGFMGATRRLDHYATLAWQPLFIIAGIGVAVIALGALFQVVQLVVSIKERAQTRDTTGDPWPGPAGGGRTLEWSLPSPVPSYAFAEIPEVMGRDAWWLAKQAGAVPTVAAAAPEFSERSALGLAIGALSFLGSFALIWHILWLVALCLGGIVVCLIVRAWSDDAASALRERVAAFGMWVYLMSDCILFACLFAAYAVLHLGTAGGPGAHALFSLPLSLLETLVLLSSSFTMGLVLIAARAGRRSTTLLLLGLTLLLGLSFLGLELSEFARFIAAGNGPGASAFLSAFFTLVGTHGLHVALGLLWLLALLVFIAMRGLGESAQRRLTTLALFWHFLDLVWIGIFTLVYLLSAL